jgi:hypothetical protein
MTDNISMILGSFLLGLVILATSGCVIAPEREGYYDHYHHRYYHEHSWHSCVERDEHCH